MCRSRSSWLLTAGLLLVAAAPSPSLAQNTVPASTPASTNPIVQVGVDLAAAAFDRVLPFDVPFLIAGAAPEGTSAVELQYAVVPSSGDLSSAAWLPAEHIRWQPARPAVAGDRFVLFVRTPLEARRRYVFRFSVLDQQRTARTITAEGRTARTPYVSADVGLLFAGDLGIGAVYVGANVYFRPVNKEAPVGSFGSVGRRLAVTVGMTLSSMADEDERTRSDLFWNQSLVLGAGYRITSSIRGGGGIIVFRESDPNPLITTKSATTTWYTSFSFDIDVASAVARWVRRGEI